MTAQQIINPHKFIFGGSYLVIRAKTKFENCIYTDLKEGENVCIISSKGDFEQCKNCKYYNNGRKGLK